MNWGVWQPDGKQDPAVYYRKYRFPTLGELYAMIAMEMIHGIRGFVGYSYSSLFYGPDKQQFAKTWPLIKQAVAFQHLMAPFLLSTEKSPDLYSVNANFILTYYTSKRNGFDKKI